jgi:hypothetical protein
MLYMHKHDIREMGDHSHCITKHQEKYETKTRWERKKCHTLDYQKKWYHNSLANGWMHEWMDKFECYNVNFYIRIFY